MNIYIVFLIYVSQLFAGFTVILDVDDTLLKEVPVDLKNNDNVRAIQYEPEENYSIEYKNRLTNKLKHNYLNDESIHYELHESSNKMTFYVAIRPGMELFLEKITEDSSNKIIIASNNDENRTKAILNTLKIGNKTLAEWGAKQAPKKIFFLNYKKSFSAIRKLYSIKDDEKVYAIDDKDHIYIDASNLDKIIKIKPWNAAEIKRFLSPGLSEKEATQTNYYEVQKIINRLPLLSNQVIENKIESSKFFILPDSEIDLSGSPELLPNDESYYERPNISQIKPEACPSLPDNWKNLVNGHLEAVAMILEMYPNHYIYFLARDGELLYDYAMTSLQNCELNDQSKKINLINISRANMKDPNLFKYMAQEGISKKNLQAGMKVMFVDTGFSGTIPKYIAERFIFEENLPFSLLSQLNTHLMCSANDCHPSTRVFLTYINKAASRIYPGALHGSIIDYEHIPRYTKRSEGFKVINNKWTPISGASAEQDGQVNREKALEYMKDLKFHVLVSGKERLEKQRAFWRKVRTFLDLEEKDKLNEELETLLKSDEPLKEAMIRDFLDLVKCHEPNKVYLLPTLESLGLKEISYLHKPNKIEVLSVHPEWTSILQNPDTEIVKLVNGSDFDIQILRNIIDELQDAEVQKIIIKSLYNANDSHKESAAKTFASILSRMYMNNDFDLKQYLLQNFNSQVHSNMKLLSLALKKTHDGFPTHYEIRTKAAQALAYVTEDVHKLFAIALTDESPVVRQEAIKSIKYRQPSDLETLSMLNSLLSNPEQDIRKKVFTLIELFYPSFKEGDNPKDYPGIKTSLDDAEIKKPNPIIALNVFNPGSETEAYSYKVSGLTWLQFKNAPKRNQLMAEKYCQDVGARLPTKDELDELRRAKGYDVPQKNFNQKTPFSFETKLPLYWSNTIDSDKNKFAFYLNGKNGEISRFEREGVALEFFCVR